MARREVRNYRPFLQKVSRITNLINAKVGSGEALSDVEKHLIASTNIPILKIMVVEKAFARGKAPISVVPYDEIIATDLVLKYLETVVNTVEKSVAHLASVQMSSHQIDEFHADLARVKSLIYQRRGGLFHSLNESLSAIERTRQVEQQLYSLFAQANSQ